MNIREILHNTQGTPLSLNLYAASDLPGLSNGVERLSCTILMVGSRGRYLETITRTHNCDGHDLVLGSGSVPRR